VLIVVTVVVVADTDSIDPPSTPTLIAPSVDNISLSMPDEEVIAVAEA
jgi:hypothetical protein